ncbi:hypothetical protein [Nostoc sp.]|uniref:hypothetical protein n=1 Tax=Nostoc sp. TaxID=1180 RepID=UPI002FF861EF
MARVLARTTLDEILLVIGHLSKVIQHPAPRSHNLYQVQSRNPKQNRPSHNRQDGFIQVLLYLLLR